MTIVEHNPEAVAAIQADPRLLAAVRRLLEMGNGPATRLAADHADGIRGVRRPVRDGRGTPGHPAVVEA
jgi:hypothetical protein